MSLIETLRKAIFANELSSNANAIYRFSNASEASGLSFGISQLDVGHNSAAVKCLQECGFTEAEIADVKAKRGGGLSAKLKANMAIVDKYDDAQISYCLDHVLTVAKSRRITFANDEAIIHAADYHNQFYMSTNGKMANALVALGRPVTAQDILKIKLSTAWGQKEPGDVNRRYNNIVRIMATHSA